MEEETIANTDNFNPTYTIREQNWVDFGSKFYQVMFISKEREFFSIGTQDSSFEKTLENLKKTIQNDPGMTGDIEDRYIGSDGEEIKDADKVTKIQQIFQDPIYLHRKRFHDLKKQNGTKYHERVLAILSKFSSDPIIFHFGHIMAYPINKPEKYLPLEKLGYILAEYYANNVNITHYDIDKLEELDKSQETLDQMYEKHKHDLVSYSYVHKYAVCYAYNNQSNI